MSDAAVPPTPAAATTPAPVTLLRIFIEFLIIGGTSFGGVVPYLRGGLVTRTGWLDDREFVEMLSICQSLPGLNATNMAVLVGQKLRGPLGALVAIVAMCLPGALLMYVVGVFYREHGDHAAVTGALKGVAAAAVGLILSTVVQLGKKSLDGSADFIFVAVTVVAVMGFHVSVPVALLGVGSAAILWHRPKRAAP
jgi:chromate transporter